MKQVLLLLTLATTSGLVLAMDFTQLNSVGNLMEQETSKFSLFLTSFETFYEKWNDVYEIFTQNEEYQRKLREKHERYGVLRSGEGTAVEVQRRIQLQEEELYLQSLLDSNQVSNDTLLNRKLHDLYKKRFSEHALRSDNPDLLPHHTFTPPLLSLQSLPLQDNSTNLAITSRRALHELIGVNVTVKMVTESYPTSCQNNGKMVSQTQKYYLCKQNANDHEWVRVEKETHDLLIANYSEFYVCKNEDVVKQVCVCPYGFYDYQCNSAIPRKCYVNVTYPKFYESCSHLPDTPAYMYSIPGFDPCHPLDFSQKQQIKFILNCATSQVQGLDSTKENVGYPYRDVLVPAPTQTFTYTATNPRTQFKSNGNEAITVQFTLFDFKWLSNFKTITTVVNTPQGVAGLEESTIEVDFPAFEESDKKKESQFVAGGRIYFETDVMQPTSESLTGKGFFDKLGYVEPPPSAKQNLGLILGITIPVVIIVIAGGIGLYCCYKKKKKAVHMD